MEILVNALRAHVRREEAEEEGLRWAAVALVLRGTSLSDSELLFIRRAVRVGDPWSGQVAFPGGRQEPIDATLEATARRETLEELTLNLTDDAHLLGVLDDLRPRAAALPSIAVRPYVFRLTRAVSVVPNAEVHSTFWAPLSALRDPAMATEHVFDRGGSRFRFPAYRWGEDVVWGMTERIVTQLLAVATNTGA